MNLLCIDVGNTSTHMARYNDGEWLDEMRLPTAQLRERDSAFFGWLTKDNADGVAYCSVVPNINSHLNKRFMDAGLQYWQLTCDNTPSLPILYPKPHEIGQDRLANSLAAKNLYGTPSIVIDMGTTVNFDIISRKGSFEGGIIAPGMAMMTRYMHEYTAQLPEIDPAEIETNSKIGRSTREAMMIGCTVGIAGMVEALLQNALRHIAPGFNEDPKIIATGGTARKLLRGRIPNVIYEDRLTLLGLVEGFKEREI